MKKRNRILATILMCLCGLLYMQETPVVQAADADRVLIQATKEDTTIVPDKYNTGCKGELTPVEELTREVDGILFVEGSNKTRRVLDFHYRNKEISGTVVLEGYDFSNYPLWTYHESGVERKIHVIFNNCKFAGVTVGKEAGNLSYEFNDCTFTTFNGSNSTLNRCRFGGSYSDGIVPFQNIEVNDCFFGDMTYACLEKEIHTDGTQLYGIAGIDVQNVHYNNCRFEVPPLKIEGSKAYVNACIMLQLEYSNAKDVSFKDCTLNGGGYTMYARGKGDGFLFDNVSFDGIRYGCANKYGFLYSDIDPSILIENVDSTDSLYIGSIWKDAAGTHLSVTNDTHQERILEVYTDKDVYRYTIPACKNGNELEVTDTYASMPFDVDIVVPEDCNYVVCYDHTMEGVAKQIRFENWGEENVYLDQATIENLTSQGNDILLEGSCGRNVTFTLTKAGVLTLSGTGATDNFHSKKFPEWLDYAEIVKEIVVEEGIETLGTSIFRNCIGVKKVSLPDSLRSIGQRAFIGCACLLEFTFPPNIETVGGYVLGNVSLKEIHYEGDNWDVVDVHDGNSFMSNKVVYYKDGEITYRIIYALNDSEEQPATHQNPTTFVPGSEISFSNPVRAGYIFEGWYRDTGFTRPIQGVQATDAKNIVVYAKWQEEPKVEQPTQTPTVGQQGAGQTQESATVKAKKPKKVKGLKVKRLKGKKLKITWKKVSKAKGYQVAIKVGKKGKFKIVKTIKKAKVTCFTKKKIKMGKVYFVKVRAYKLVDGKRVYGAYSVVVKRP